MKFFLSTCTKCYHFVIFALLQYFSTENDILLTNKASRCSDDDVDELSKLEMKSTRLAVVTMLTDISRRKENWLELFIEALKATSNNQLHDYLITNIEPKLAKAGKYAS